MRVTVIAALVATFVVYWGLNRVSPMTLEESQQAIDQRIDELAAYLDPSERLGTPEFTRRLGIDAKAARQLDLLLYSEKGSAEIEAIDLLLMGPWDFHDVAPLEPTARAAALAHPLLRELLDAWVTQTGKPSDEEIDSSQYQWLHRYALAALADASYRGGEGATALWANRIVDLVETQLVRHSYEGLVTSNNMLKNFARHLEEEPRLPVASADRDLLLDRVRGLKPLLASPQQAAAMEITWRMQALGGSLLTRADGVARGKTVRLLTELGPWQNRVLAAQAIKLRRHRHLVLTALRNETEYFSHRAGMFASGAGDLWRGCQSAKTAVDDILQHLEKP